MKGLLTSILVSSWEYVFFTIHCTPITTNSFSDKIVYVAPDTPYLSGGRLTLPILVYMCSTGCSSSSITGRFLSSPTFLRRADGLTISGHIISSLVSPYRGFLLSPSSDNNSSSSNNSSSLLGVSKMVNQSDGNSAMASPSVSIDPLWFDGFPLDGFPLDEYPLDFH